MGSPVGASSKESTCQCRRQKRLSLHHCVRKIPWCGKWQPTPVFLPGKSHGQRSLAGYGPCGHKELATTEVTEHSTRSRYLQGCFLLEIPGENPCPCPFLLLAAIQTPWLVILSPSAKNMTPICFCHHSAFSIEVKSSVFLSHPHTSTSSLFPWHRIQVSWNN